MTVEELQALKIGLVLGGGGAKGAYELGCWKVLRENGIRISMVSGSSVGALNAVLIAADSWDSGGQLWNNLGIFRVMGLRPAKIFLLPLWLLCTAFRLGFVPIRNRDASLLFMGRLLLLWLAVFIVFAGPAKSGEVCPQWLLNILDIVGVVFVLMAFGPFVKAVILNWGFTTNSPLEAEVESTFTDKCLSNINIPTFATLSCFMPHLDEVDFWDGWVPRYVRLNELAGDSVRKILLQSAGLPGIFPVKTVLGQGAIDGGWCDNVPIAPLLYGTKEKLDLIFVIYLNESERHPRIRRGPFRWNEKGFTCDMKTGLLDMNDEAEHNWRIHEYAQGLGAKPDADRFYRHRKWKRAYDPNLPHLIPVVPSRSLGNFFTGTLNFSQRKAKKLIEAGENDMEQVIKDLLKQEWRTFDRGGRALRRAHANPFKPYSEVRERFRAQGQAAVIYIYQKSLSDNEIQFRLLDEDTQLYIGSYYAHASDSITLELHRRHSYRVRFNNDLQKPEMEEIIEEIR